MSFDSRLPNEGLLRMQQPFFRYIANGKSWERRAETLYHKNIKMGAVQASGRPGRAGLGLAPTASTSGNRDNGPGNGSFANPVLSVMENC